MGINLAIFNFREKLVQDINESKLPPAVVKFILLDALRDIDSYYIEAVEQERKALKEKEGVEDGEEICKTELAE